MFLDGALQEVALTSPHGRAKRSNGPDVLVKNTIFGFAIKRSKNEGVGCTKSIQSAIELI